MRDFDENWLIDKKRSALNYKMRICADGSPLRDEKNINKMYFGNMGENSEKKKTIFYKEEINLEIICFNSQLREKIDELIIDFFLNNNFGTRQSKGFGAFLCRRETEENYMTWRDIKDRTHYGDKVLMWADLSGVEDVDAAMNNAAMVYAIMKSGINMSKNTNAWNFAQQYCKYKENENSVKEILTETKRKKCEEVSIADLDEYIEKNKKKMERKKSVNMAKGWKFCLLSIVGKFEGNSFQDKLSAAVEDELCFYDQKKYIKGFLNAGAGLGEKGDKAFIKSKDSLWRENGETVGKRAIEGNNDTEVVTYEFLRIILGMADHYEFKDPDKKRVGTVYIRNFKNISVENNEVCGNDKLEEEIVRFKSPITMKIYKEGILFIFNEIPCELLGKWFYVSKKKDAEESKRELEKDCFIKSPDKWDWKCFVNDFIKYYSGHETNIKLLTYLFKGASYLKLNS